MIKKINFLFLLFVLVGVTVFGYTGNWVDDTTYALGDKLIKMPSGITRNTKVIVNGKAYGINPRWIEEKKYIVFGEDNDAFYNSIKDGFLKNSKKDGEWRFLGYTKDGNIFSNSDFPNDVETGLKPWEKNMIRYPWDRGLCQPSNLLRTHPKQVNETILQVLVEKGFPNNGRSDDELVRYYKDFFLVLSLVGEGTPGAVRYWHIWEG